jgi:hypothetical protein
MAYRDENPGETVARSQARVKTQAGRGGERGRPAWTPLNFSILSDIPLPVLTRAGQGSRRRSARPGTWLNATGYVSPYVRVTP